MTRSEQPTFPQLLDWLEGRLDEQGAQQVESLLRSADAETEAELAWLRSFLASAELARAAAPPADVRADLKEKFAHFSRERSGPSLLERLVATLTFDSARGPALAGVRSVQTLGKQRQLIYETDLAEIALNIYPNSQDENLTLNGQIYPRTDLSPAGLSVQIVAPDGTEEIGLTTSDDLGEFTLEDIPAGRYEVLISSGGFEISLPEIHLQR